MQVLDDCFELAKIIREKNQDIEDLRACTSAPKNQTISDMPRGGGTKSNPLDNYLIRLEKLERYRNKIQKELDENWLYAKWLIEISGVDDTEIIELMRKRFYLGLPWKKCANDMKVEFAHSKWNVNKCFRVYSFVLCKISKIQK